MNFYLDNGFLNIPEVERYADKHSINFILIIGKRQVGKTYGVLKNELDSDKHFVLMRRTSKELSLISKGVNSPFESIDGYENKISFSGSADDTTMEMSMIDNPETKESHTIGLAVALSTVASIRGFNGKPYTDLVYDECIPESHVYKIPHEDEAFLNAYVTINGNRELSGLPPLRAWLLANSNKLDCAILKALKLTEIVEKMTRNGEEIRLLKERGVLIFLPDSKEITEKRSKTALYRAIDGENEFTKMSLGNEFSHNDFTDVGREELNQYRLLANVAGFALLKHKSSPRLYVCESFYSGSGVPEYDNTDYYKNKFIKDFPNVRSYFLRGKIKFVNASIKYQFLAYMKLI